MSAGATDARAQAVAEFLAGAGFGAARLDWLAADASFRRYGRLSNGPRPALVMDAPPGREDVRPWLSVAGYLCALGFSAPEVIAADVPAGLLLIEDFGDDTFTRLLAKGADEAALYDLAVDILAQLHEAVAAAALPDWLPPYDAEKLLAEAALFTDWYLPAVRGRDTAAAERDEYLALMGTALAPALAAPRTLVLRDYHVDNLMRVPGRTGTGACGLLDFQDAVAGPAVYDLVSLVEDARRDLGLGIGARARARYFSRRPTLDRDRFETEGAALAANRNAKIIGIFTRLCRRDGKPRYLAHIPRVWRLLEADLARDELAELRRWFADAVPRESRRAPEAHP